MGRSIHPQRGPRTSLVPDREVERALREGGTPSFGIRRQLSEPWADKILGITLQMQAEGGLPDATKVVVCTDLGVTLLGQKVLARRLQRGAIGGQQVRRVRTELARVSTRRDTIPIKIGEIHVLKNRVIYAVVTGVEIEREGDGVYAGLVIGGLKGVERVNGHLTLATALHGRAMSQADQVAAIALLQDRLFGEAEAEPWRTYPKPDVFED